MRGIWVMAAILVVAFLQGDGSDPRKRLSDLLRDELNQKGGDLYRLIGQFLGREKGGNLEGRCEMLRLLRGAIEAWLARNAPDRPLPPPAPRKFSPATTRCYTIQNLITGEDAPPPNAGLVNLLDVAGAAPLAQPSTPQFLQVLRLVGGTSAVSLKEDGTSAEVTTKKPLHARLQALLKSLSDVATPVGVDFEVWSVTSGVLTRLLEDGGIVEGAKRDYLFACRRRGDAFLVASGSVPTRDWFAGCATVGTEFRYLGGYDKGRRVARKTIRTGIVFWVRPLSVGGARWLLQIAAARIRTPRTIRRSYSSGPYELPFTNAAFLTTTASLWEGQWTLVGATTALSDEPGTSLILITRVRPAVEEKR